MLAMTLSSSCSHVAVAYTTLPQSGDKKTTGETKLAMYSLPVSSWMAELPSTAEESSQVSIASQNKVSINLFPQYEAPICSFCLLGRK